MKQIIIFPKGTLSPKDRERLTRAGVVGIEAEDPSKVVVAIPNAPLMSDSDLTSCALNALASERNFGSPLALRFLDSVNKAFHARAAAPSQSTEGKQP